MSVVNKMLRDLDNRKHAQPNSQPSANYVPPKSSQALWIAVVCLGLLSFMAASYSVYLVSQTSTVAPLKPSLELNKVPEATSIQKDDQYASRNKDASNVNVTSDIEDTRPLGSELIAHLPNVMPAEIQSFASPVISNTNKSITSSVAKTGLKNDLSATNNPLAIQVKPFVVAPSDGAESQLSRLRAKAYMASQENDETRVVQLLHEILLIAPDEMKTRKQLAALLFSKSQLNEAKDVLSKGIQQAPSDSSLRLMLSRIFYRLGDLSQAFTVLAEHPYSALANDELVSFRAALAEKTGNYGTAQQDYLLLVQRNPNDAKWWLGLGVSQDKQKLSEQAISSYQQAQSLNQLPQQVDTFVAKRIQLLARRS